MANRFHAEVNSIQLDEFSVKFNIFSDDLQSLVADLEKVIAYVTGSAPVQSKSPRPVSGVATGAAVLPPAPKPPPAPAKIGTCVNCGSDALEWVTGTRKDNGKPFAAYKCQECGKWQPEAR